MSVTNTNIIVNKFELCLTNTYLLNNRMRHLEFKLLSDKPLNYIAGQFVSLLIENNSKIIRRNFSIANSPSNTYQIEIAATFVPNGIASTTLWNMKIGDHINASGPFGIFVLPPDDFIGIKRYILVATGTGVTPYRAMLQSIKLRLDKANMDNIEFILLLGVRDRYELLYAEDFINFAARYPNFKFIACYSRENQNNHHNTDNHEQTQPNNKQEYFGYVQNKLIELNLKPETDVVYLCGNPDMIDQSVIILEKFNIPRNNIKREKYISSK